MVNRLNMALMALVTTWTFSVSAETRKLEEAMKRYSDQLARLERETERAVRDLHDKLKKQGGDQAIRQATEYQYLLYREVKQEYLEHQPTAQELDAIAEELSELMEQVARARNKQNAEEKLDRAMSILFEDLEKRLQRQLDILETFSRRESQTVFAGVNSNDRHIRDYSYSLAKLEILLESSDRLSTLIASYEGGKNEIAARPFRQAANDN